MANKIITSKVKAKQSSVNIGKLLFANWRTFIDITNVLFQCFNFTRSLRGNYLFRRNCNADDDDYDNGWCCWLRKQNKLLTTGAVSLVLSESF